MKFTAATSTNESAINIPSIHLVARGIEKNSITNSDMSAEKPAKTPRVFQEPSKLPVLSDRMPRDSTAGRNVWKPWKTNTKA